MAQPLFDGTTSLFVNLTESCPIVPGATVSRALVNLPEGRMKRRNLLDSSGRPLTVRAGIADILEALPSGRMLLLYNGGMHHIQVPGEGWPKLFKPMRVRFELVDIARYKQEVMRQEGVETFQQAVIQDLTRRRDTLCPTAEPGGAVPDLSS